MALVQVLSPGDISTHMPLARHDSGLSKMFPTTSISTHMPLARHDCERFWNVYNYFKFLLTCLLRGMTVTN